MSRRCDEAEAQRIRAKAFWPTWGAVGCVPLTPEEAERVKPFCLGLLEGHRLLVDRDGFLRAVRDRLERRPEELGARRLVDEIGNPYWDLKPGYKPGEDVVL